MPLVPICFCLVLVMVFLPVNSQDVSNPFEESDTFSEVQQSKMILGLSLEELKAKWGEPDSRRFRNSLGRPMGQNDKDEYLFTGDWPESWNWKRGEFQITASFREGKCCVLEVFDMKQPSLEKALEIAAELMPVELESHGWGGDQDFSLYSIAPADYYQFQFWGSDRPPYFLLKAPGLWKEMYTKTDVCVEDDHGIFWLPVEHGVREKLQISGTPETGFSSHVWHEKDCALSWDVRVTESRSYIVELTWSREEKEGKATLELDVMGKKELSWPMENTGGFHGSGKIFSRKIGVCRLPAGQSTVKLHIPDLEEDLRGMDFVCLRFIPESGYEEKVAQLRKMPRLGMYLHDLELLWGKSRPGRRIPLDQAGGTGDVDNNIYMGMDEGLAWRQWYVAGLWINAVMYKQECIALQFEMPDIKPEEALDIVNSLVPGMKFSPLPATVTAPLTVYTPDKSLKFQYRGNRFEVKSSKLVRNLRGNELQKIAQLSNRPLLGLAAEKINLVMGNPEPMMSFFSIEKRGDKTDTDWELYRGLNSQLKSSSWKIQEGSLHVTALYLQDTCISLQIRKPGGFSIEECLNTLARFAPGIRFPVQPSSKKVTFTLYSSNFNKGYKLQNWPAQNYMEIKASGLVRQLQAEHMDQLKRGGKKLLDILTKQPELKSSSLFGKSRNELNKFFGVPEPCSVRYALESWEWKLPDTTLVLLGSFLKEENKEQCRDLTIADKNKALDPVLALAIAKQIIQPVTFKIPVIEDRGKNFKFTSSDPEKRFLIIWEEDRDYGKYLRIKDESLDKERQPDVINEKDPSFDHLKELL